MTPPVSRRELMTASAAAAAGIGLMGPARPRRRRRGGSVPAAAPPRLGRPNAPLALKTKPHKALIARPTEDDLKRLKEAGFEGAEGSREVQPEEAAKMRAIAEKMGMRIHSARNGWAEFNSPDRKEAERTFAESEAALRTAEAFGAIRCSSIPVASARRRAGRPGQHHAHARGRGSSRSSSTRRTGNS